ncbi:MAG TPA: hypothetical protein VM286_01100 [Candidatus Thermoplasmatota archaeon]|nr:hypothetical protein [Candidatus Thermoplasmatota archaeon]
MMGSFLAAMTLWSLDISTHHDSPWLYYGTLAMFVISGIPRLYLKRRMEWRQVFSDYADQNFPGKWGLAGIAVSAFLLYLRVALHLQLAGTLAFAVVLIAWPIAMGRAADDRRMMHVGWFPFLTALTVLAWSLLGPVPLRDVWVPFATMVGFSLLGGFRLLAPRRWVVG